MMILSAVLVHVEHYNPHYDDKPIIDAQCAHPSLICSGERSLSEELPHFGIGTPKPRQNFRL